MRKLETLNIKDVKHLCKHLGCSEKELEGFCAYPKSHYHQFPLRRKNKTRPIAEPIGKLKSVLKKLQQLLNRLEIPSYMHGGIKGRSPITNANGHTRKAAVLNFDLEDFFPSVKPNMVYRLFNKKLGCSPDVSHIITRLVTLNGGLPQGSPTSTIVANLLIVPLCNRLNVLALRHNCDYTQFVDDGTLSGPGYLENLRPLIEKIINQEKLKASPKPHKRLTQYRNQEQVVTGVKVNRKVSVPAKKYNSVKNDLKDIRATASKGTVLDTKKLNSMQGRIAHIKMLDHSKGLELQRYFENQILNSCE